MRKQKKKPKCPQPFGHPDYPTFDFYIGFGTVQVTPIRGNSVLYQRDFKRFKKWLDKVEEYTKSQVSK